MIPERLTGRSACDIALAWVVDQRTVELAQAAALAFEEQTRRRVDIISGFRTSAEQERLRGQGRPTALDSLSTHRSCPATGMDISVGPLPTTLMKVLWGTQVVFAGLRWGGGSPVDLQTGIPEDWNHLDRGPRSP